jgi:glycosyltransferase involved in cell wall biosynthesis
LAAIQFEHESIPDLISIVMPARNAEKYIGATLESIGNQSYAHWELVVVEDGSTGPTQQIVQSFQRSGNYRVIYVRNDRSYGAGHTRNVAFSKASGEFIALLDSDDRWHPDHLAISHQHLKQTGKDIVFSTVQMVADGTDEEIGVWGPTDAEWAEFPQSIYGRSFVTPSATVMRRQVIADVGPWSTTHRYCEDYDFWLRCIAMQKKFHYIEGIYCLYRKNHEGATTQKLSGLLEEVAMTTERYMRMPGLKLSVCRKYAVDAHKIAARFHLTSDRTRDPSADPARAGRILLRGWRVQPRRLENLWNGLKLLARENVRRKYPRPTVLPPQPFVRMDEFRQPRSGRSAA